VRRAGVAAVAVLAAALVAAGSAAPATTTPRECRGLMICVTVVGPWVATGAKPVQYLLSCPRGYIVGGTDAELSDRAIDVVFLGNQGAPVNPGITTARDALFIGTYVGAGDVAATFRPHLGCIPAGGGGGRIPTAVGIFPPGKPTVRHARNVTVRIGKHRLVGSCATGERLVSGWHAIAFKTNVPPPSDIVHGVTATQSVGGGRVVVDVAAAARATVQVGVLCAGGR
jgi:hypothetical protein